MAPWWRDFRGEVQVADGGGDGAAGGAPPTYRVRGVAERLPNGDVEVTELPVRTWTQAFKAHLEKLVEMGTVSDFVNRSTDSVVHFLVKGLPRDADLVAASLADAADSSSPRIAKRRTRGSPIRHRREISCATASVGGSRRTAQPRSA